MTTYITVIGTTSGINLGNFFASKQETIDTIVDDFAGRDVKIIISEDKEHWHYYEDKRGELVELDGYNVPDSHICPNDCAF